MIYRLLSRLPLWLRERFPHSWWCPLYHDEDFSREMYRSMREAEEQLRGGRGEKP